MKISAAIFAVAVLMLAEAGFAQSFVNLNFESANFSGYAPGSPNVPINSALPGWSGYFMTGTVTNQVTQVWYDGVSLGGNMLSVIDTNAFGFMPIQGKYSAFLFGEGPGFPVSAKISQTGLVPAGTLSLQAKMSWFAAAPIITLNGQVINMVPLQTFSDYTLYGSDISSFANQVAELSFTEPPPDQGSPSGLLLDSIVFSPQQVPEPTVLALLGGGALLFGFFRRRNSSR